MKTNSKKYIVIGLAGLGAATYIGLITYIGYSMHNINIEANKMLKDAKESSEKFDATEKPMEERAGRSIDEIILKDSNNMN
jgi:hypothetical protein